MDGAFAMTLTQFKRFTRECRCTKVSPELVDQVFYMANIERGSKGEVVQVGRPPGQLRSPVDRRSLTTPCYLLMFVRCVCCFACSFLYLYVCFPTSD